MVKKTKSFWQEHSLNYLNMAFGESKSERITDPDGYAQATNSCGDSIEFFIVGTSTCLDYVSYRANACLHSEVCANAVAHMACGLSLEQAWLITSEQVVEFLETLPAHEKHCADMAVEVFQKALAQLMEQQRNGSG